MQSFLAGDNHTQGTMVIVVCFDYPCVEIYLPRSYTLLTANLTHKHGSAGCYRIRWKLLIKLLYSSLENDSGKLLQAAMESQRRYTRLYGDSPI
jgi:hypothetical protein